MTFKRELFQYSVCIEKANNCIFIENVLSCQEHKYTGGLKYPCLNGNNNIYSILYFSTKVILTLKMSFFIEKKAINALYLTSPFQTKAFGISFHPLGSKTNVEKTTTEFQRTEKPPTVFVKFCFVLLCVIMNFSLNLYTYIKRQWYWLITPEACRKLKI